MIPKIHAGLHASRAPPPHPAPQVKFHIFTKRSQLRHGAALQKPNSTQMLSLFRLVHTANITFPVTLPLSFTDALPYSQTAFARRTSGARPCKFQSSNVRDRRNISNNVIIQFLNFNLSFMDVPFQEHRAGCNGNTIRAKLTELIYRAH